MSGAPTKPVIACVRPGAIGDILMTLNCTQALRRKYPEYELVYFTNKEMKSLLEKTILAAGFNRVDWDHLAPKGDLVFQMMGYPTETAYGGQPMKKHLVEYFGDGIGLQVTLDEFCLPVPVRPEVCGDRYITIHPKAKWSIYKNWPMERWQEVCDHFTNAGIGVYQIGGPDDPKLASLSGYPMEQGFDVCLSFLAHSTMHLGVDTWSNHATNIVWSHKGKTRAVILWGSTQPLAAGYPHNKNVLLGLPCQPCFKEDPKLQIFHHGICNNPGGQTYQDPQHACMHQLGIDRVLGEARSLWEELTRAV